MEDKEIVYSISDLARHILGEEFKGVARFFLGIFRKCHEYEEKGNEYYIVPFVTRRCHVLGLIFQEILANPDIEVFEKEDPDELFRKEHTNEFNEIALRHFVTDSDILSMTGKIVDIYREKKVFPQILVADELLVHGRSLNQFLLDLEEKICESLKEYGADPEQLREELIASIDLKVYIRNNKTILLYSRYQDRLRISKTADALEWRNFSKRAAELITFSNRNNVGYSWSFRFKADKEWQCKESKEFKKVVTDLQDNKEYNYLWLYPNDNSPKMIASIRFKQSYVQEDQENIWMCVPYIMWGKCDFEKVIDLHERILHDYSQNLDVIHFLSNRDNQLQVKKENYYRWLTETNDLILNSMIMKKFWNELGFSEDIYKILVKSVDYEHVIRNYKNIPGKTSNCEENLKTAFEKILEQRFENSILESYLEKYTDGMEALYQETLEPWKQTEFCNKEVLRDIEDVVYEMGIEAEKNAYERCKSNVIFSDAVLAGWGYHCSVSEVCARYIEKAKKNQYTINMYEAISTIVQAVDLGMVGMYSYYDKDEKAIFTAARSDEQALFIKPFRYKDFINILKICMNKYGNDWDDVEMDLKRFMSRLTAKFNEQSGITAIELYTFLRQLVDSGDKLDDWQISLTGSVGKIIPRTKEYITPVDELMNSISNQMKYGSSYDI